MEEDIKIVNAYLDKYEQQYVSEEKHKLLKAIENILGRLEQLEKENEIYRKTNCENAKSVLDIETNSIPKSVIREKIEELKEIHKEQDWTQKQGFYYDCYNELLGGSNE